MVVSENVLTKICVQTELEDLFYINVIYLCSKGLVL